MTDANFLYYHINADNLIYWKDLDANEGGELQLRTSEEIKALHVRDGVVYYIMNTSVLSFDLSQKITDTVLTAEGTQKIGTVHSPISLAFRGENLLVADSGINAVQEFAPAGDGNWRYTGFAITGSGRGENRISGAADAAYAGGTVYILDGNGEILAVGAGGAQTDYRRIAPGEKLTFSPVKIETDGKTILLADAVQAAFYNPETGELTPAAAVRSPLYDIAYANGMYYILSGDRVIAYDAETLSPVSLITSLAVGENSLIAADVDRNLYLYDSGTGNRRPVRGRRFPYSPFLSAAGGGDLHRRGLKRQPLRPLRGQPRLLLPGGDGIRGDYDRPAGGGRARHVHGV